MRTIVSRTLAAAMALGMAVAFGAAAEAGVGPGPIPAPAQSDAAGGAIKLSGAIVFETGSDKLKPESDAALQGVKAYLDSKPAVTKLRIEGHTDSDGSASANQTLSEKRALAVAKWLVKHGISCKRLIAVGFGQTKPVAPNDTAANKALNRRTAFVNAELKGKAIGGQPLDGGGKIAGDPCS